MLSRLQQKDVKDWSDVDDVGLHYHYGDHTWLNNVTLALWGHKGVVYQPLGRSEKEIVLVYRPHWFTGVSSN